MKMRTLSKKILAISLSLAMLLSCMVWSGVSAATEYTCNFTNYGITSSSDVDAFGNSIATVVDTGEADYGSAMQLEYLTGATSTKAGFRFFGNTTGGSDVTSSNGQVQYNSGAAVGNFYVEFNYKVLTVAGDVDLYVACGSKPWGQDGFNALGSAEVIESLTGATEWKTGRTVVRSNSSQNSAVHIYLDTTDAAAAAGTQVLIDNVKVIKDYVAPTVVLDYGYDSKTETLSGLQGNAVSFPTPVRDGYVFQGWYDAEDNKVESATYGAGGTTVTYTAKWAESDTKSAIAFDTGVAPAIDLIEGEAGATATLPTPTYDTYKFGGWYEDDGFTTATDGLFPAAGETKTLYAKWDKINYQVVKSHFNEQPTKSDGTTNAGYLAGNTTNSGDNNNDVYYVLEDGEGYMKLTPQGNEVRTVGFRVYGNEWQRTISDGTSDITVAGDTDYSRAVKGLAYRITFKYKVVSLDVPVTLAVHNYDGALNSDCYTTGAEEAQVASKALTAADVSEEWATFEWAEFTAVDTAAWRVGVKPTGTVSEAGIEILIDDIVIEWVPDQRRTTLTFDNNDGTGDTSTSSQLTDDAAVLADAPAYARAGYEFTGWATAEGETITTVPVNDVTLYAQWVEDATITTVSFNTSGGDALADVYGKAGTEVTLPTPTKNAYNFGGWYLDETLENKAESAVFPDEGVTTLYAKWDLPSDAKTYGIPSGLVGTMDFETGELSDYIHQTVSTGAMEFSEVQNHTTDGSRSFLHVFKSGDNSQRGRPRIVLSLGDATKAEPLVVKEGESYTITFWLRADTLQRTMTFYAATMGASDVDTMINTTSGAVHTQQTLDYYAVGSAATANYNAKEPSSLTLQPEQWTQIVMHIPSIVLDDANDVNYLAIGYTMGGTSNSTYVPTNIYLDDIAVYTDMEIKGTQEGVQDFEAGTIDNFDDSAMFDMNISTDAAHSGTTSLKATLSGAAGAQRTRPRLVLKTGDATTASNFVVQEGHSYTVSFWVRSSMDTGVGTFYLATMGATDLDTQIVATSGACHTLQALSYSSRGVPMKGGASSSWGTADEVGSVSLTANVWTQVVATIPSVTLDEAGVDNYLALGYTIAKFSGDYSTTLWVDDIAIYDTTFADGVEMLDDITSGYQYVAGGVQDNGAIEGVTGSAIYVENDVEKTAFRVAAKYTAGDAIDKVVINGQSYQIVERGMLLGYAETLGDTVLTVDTTAAQGLAGKASTLTPTNYWDENAGTNRVTYTMLVKGVTKELKDTPFVARAFMVILVDGVEYTVYSSMSTTFSSQGIYDGTDGTATWFS